MIDNLLLAMDKAIAALQKNPAREITLLHHNDTDGLSSGTILLNALSQSGYKVSRFSLEKPYPQVLEKILPGDDQIIFFADFAGKIAPIIADMNKGRNLIIILDHHPTEGVIDDSVFCLDGELFGLKGDRDISASATCYLFANRLLQSMGKSAEPYSHLGALGAIGDGFLVEGCLSGVNRDVMKIAEEKSLLRVEKTEEGEQYFMNLGDREYKAEELCRTLDTMGGVGYYSNGTDRGVEICQSGIDSATAEYADELIRKQNIIFRNEIERLKETINTTEHLQWFDVEDRFQPMGVKMIGVFCTMIKDMDFLDRSKYLAGFQHVPDRVPGFGEIRFDSTKISMRVSEELTVQIRAGRIPGLNTFLPEATEHLGGFADACHGLSAATTVKIGQEQQLIDEVEIVLSKRRMK